MAGPGPSERTTIVANGHSYGSFPSPDASAQSASEGRIIPETTDTSSKPKATKRALAPDLLRGTLMVLMTFDHVVVTLNTFDHGTGRTTEGDGAIVHEWNRPLAFTIRTLTHLCASGFTLLMGMGVVYLTESRLRLGWSSWRLLRYFAVRGLVLAACCVFMAVAFTAGQVWLLNMVLLALGVDLFLSGAILIAFKKTEPIVARLLARVVPSKATSSEEATEPLLHETAVEDHQAAVAKDVSWHIHNALLLLLSIITIWWNHWFSAFDGHCPAASSDHPDMGVLSMDIESPWLKLWIWPVLTKRIMSVFPPLGWLSFSIMGLLYGRILSSKPHTRSVLVASYAAVGTVFMLLFVLTRLLQFGNLSQDCLQTPEQHAHPNANPYLLSPESFFYIVKYPPDFAFWAFTLAGNFFMLAMFDAIPVYIAGRFSMLLDFGSSALFFYLVHLLVAFGLGAVLISFFGHETDVPDFQDPSKKQKAVDSVAVYFALVLVVLLIMWPACRWYSRFKSRKSADSVWRLF